MKKAIIGRDNMEDNELRKKEIELRNRINKLDTHDLRAALFSVTDLKALEDMIKIGEEYHQVMNK
jgi:hypothetical protein